MLVIVMVIGTWYLKIRVNKLDGCEWGWRRQECRWGARREWIEDWRGYMIDFQRFLYKTTKILISWWLW